MESDLKPDAPAEAKEANAIKVTLPLDKPTSMLIQDANLFIIAIPLGMSKETAMGIMFNELCELRAYMKKMEMIAQQSKKPGIVRAGADALKSLIKP